MRDFFRRGLATVACAALMLGCGGSSSQGIVVGDGSSASGLDGSDGKIDLWLHDGAFDFAELGDANFNPAGDAAIDLGPMAPMGIVDPRHWMPKAKGLWIWYFDYIGMTAQQAATLAKTDGVGYVLLKSGMDADYWSTRYTAANLSEFTSRGMPVFAWPYITPENIAGSILAVAQAAQVVGTSGVVLDVEAEFEGATAATFSAQAKQLCQGIRAAVPGVWLGYTSGGWVGYHPGFPYATFDQNCGDAFFPQVYWSDRGVTWTYGYDQAVQMIAAAKLTAPVWMVQSNDLIYMGGAPSTADLNSFFDKAGPLSSLWSFPGQGDVTALAQLPQLHFAN